MRLAVAPLTPSHEAHNLSNSLDPSEPFSPSGRTLLLPAHARGCLCRCAGHCRRLSLSLSSPPPLSPSHPHPYLSLPPPPSRARTHLEAASRRTAAVRLARAVRVPLRAQGNVLPVVLPLRRLAFSSISPPAPPFRTLPPSLVTAFASRITNYLHLRIVSERESKAGKEGDRCVWGSERV
jgi:hypothetical protein